LSGAFFSVNTSIADGEKLIGQAIYAGLERGFAISGVDKAGKAKEPDQKLWNRWKASIQLPDKQGNSISLVVFGQVL
jgi:hypothetical protein